MIYEQSTKVKGVVEFRMSINQPAVSYSHLIYYNGNNKQFHTHHVPDYRQDVFIGPRVWGLWYHLTMHITSRNKSRWGLKFKPLMLVGDVISWQTAGDWNFAWDHGINKDLREAPTSIKRQTQFLNCSWFGSSKASYNLTSKRSLKLGFSCFWPRFNRFSTPVLTFPI